MNVEQTYFDRIDEHDELTGEIAGYDVVHAEGLWHRGVHVILHTADKRIVMQKRAPSLKYHPDEIEVSVGGGVDAGESPEAAIVREIREELGLKISQERLRFIGKTKFNHRTKTQTNRVFIYSYTVLLDDNELNFLINKNETSAAFLISEHKLRRALKVHRIKNMGKISSQYAYWKYLVNAI